MKKILIIMGLVLYLAAAAAGAETTPAQPAETQQVNGSGWILLGLDAGLAGWAVYAVLDQIRASTDYETLRSAIDNTTEANYYRLLYEQNKVNGRSDMALLAGCASGLSLLYTALDYLWLHNAFPVEVKAVFDPAKRQVLTMLKMKF